MQALSPEKVHQCVFTNCVEDALTLCTKCGKYYCLDHASDLEPTKFCQDCLKVEDATLETAPLTDTEGTRHQGKVIRPVGIVFSQNGKLIHEMTDDELREYITRYQSLVKDCERSLDYSRITLGNALFEAGHREIAKVIRATGEVVFISKKPTVTQQNKKPRPAKSAMNEDALIDFITKNLSPEQLAKFLAKKKA
jgi:hypothetical protein